MDLIYDHKCSSPSYQNLLYFLHAFVILHNSLTSKFISCKGLLLLLLLLILQSFDWLAAGVYSMQSLVRVSRVTKC